MLLKEDTASKKGKSEGDPQNKYLFAIWRGLVTAALREAKMRAQRCPHSLTDAGFADPLPGSGLSALCLLFRRALRETNKFLLAHRDQLVVLWHVLI